jgi:hypothetical protein
MKYFPDESSVGIWARHAVAVLPLVYLIVALLYSANSAPWGRWVDPESEYAMNGLAWAAGYPMMKADHPGTTTILLIGIVIRVWTFLAGRADVVEFGLKNFDAIIYVSRAAEALILSGVLLAAGIIVRNATRSALAAVLFQVGPLVHIETLKFGMIQTSDSLMISCAMFGMALVLKAAIDESPPTTGLGAAGGLIFALGLSSKFLHMPLVILSVSLLRNRKAFAVALLTGVVTFFLFNRIFHPNVFSGGSRWLTYLLARRNEGETSLFDIHMFWRNIAEVIAAAPVIFSVFTAGALAALARMWSSRRYLDPVSLTLVAFALTFAAYLVATSRHFYLHYMTACWVLTGGVLVLTVIEIRRLFPAISPRATAAVAVTICTSLIMTTLLEGRREALQWIVLNETGANLSKAVMTAGPSCANVSSMFVRAPENELNFGAEFTLGPQQMLDKFSDAYARAFKVPLFDHSFYHRRLTRNFQSYSYVRLAAEYPCIVVRIGFELNATTSDGLLELRPEHCVVADIQVYTVGIACESIGRAAQNE